MLSGISKHHFGAYPALLLLVILARHQSCSASKNGTVDCAPSSCGNIHNISYPFRLSTDPNNSCGNKKYEFTCENNRPALYLNKVKYYVQAIHYSNFTIRLVDADVQKDDCFSLPHHSLIINPLDKRDYLPYNHGWFRYYTIPSVTFIFISCPKPISRPLSPPKYIVDASSCKNGSTLFNSHNMEGYSSYVLIDYVFFGDIPDLCHVNLKYITSFSFDQPKNGTNISYIDVHDSIVYGFDLSWSGACCEFPKENPCKLDEAIISGYCNVELSGGPIRDAIVNVWPVNKYVPAGYWIQYSSSAQP